jgi:hypothetical protein
LAPADDKGRAQIQLKLVNINKLILTLIYWIY